MSYQVDLTKYLDVQEIMKEEPWADIYVIIADNGCGKTYSAVKWQCEGIEKGERACTVRQTDLETQNILNGYKDMLNSDKYYFSNKGIFELTEGNEGYEGNWNKNKIGKQVIPFVYLSNLNTSVPQSIRASRIMIDEFISDGSGRKVKFDIRLWKRAFNRLTRPVDPIHPPKTVLLSNPHTLEHDLIFALGIDIDWDKLAAGEIQYISDKKNKIYTVVIPKQFDIKEMEATYEANKIWDIGTHTKDNYQFLPNKYKRIFPNPLDEWKPTIRFVFDNNAFTMGPCKDGYYCFHESSLEGRAQLTTYVLELEDVLQSNYKLLKSVDSIRRIFGPYLKACIESKCYWSSVYCKDSVGYIQDWLDTLLNDNE